MMKNKSYCGYTLLHDGTCLFDMGLAAPLTFTQDGQQTPWDVIVRIHESATATETESTVSLDELEDAVLSDDQIFPAEEESDVSMSAARPSDAPQESQPQEELLTSSMLLKWYNDPNAAPRAMQQSYYDRRNKVNTLRPEGGQLYFKLSSENLRYDCQIRFAAKEYVEVVPDPTPRAPQEDGLWVRPIDYGLHLEDMGLAEWDEVVVTVTQVTSLGVLVVWREKRGYLVHNRRFPLQLWGCETLAEAYPVGSRWRVFAHKMEGDLIVFRNPAPQEDPVAGNELKLKIGDEVETLLLRLNKKSGFAVLIHRGWAGWCWLSEAECNRYRHSLARSQPYRLFVTGVDRRSRRLSFSADPILKDDELPISVPLVEPDTVRDEALRQEAPAVCRTLCIDEQICASRKLRLGNVMYKIGDRIVVYVVKNDHPKFLLTRDVYGNMVSIAMTEFAVGVQLMRRVTYVGQPLEVELIDVQTTLMRGSRMRLLDGGDWALEAGKIYEFELVDYAPETSVLRYDAYHYVTVPTVLVERQETAQSLQTVMTQRAEFYGRIGAQNLAKLEDPQAVLGVDVASEVEPPRAPAVQLQAVETSEGVILSVIHDPHPTCVKGEYYTGRVVRSDDFKIYLDCDGCPAVLPNFELCRGGELCVADLYRPDELIYDLICLDYDAIQDCATMSLVENCNPMWNHVDVEVGDHICLQIMRVGSKALMASYHGYPCAVSFRELRKMMDNPSEFSVEALVVGSEIELEVKELDATRKRMRVGAFSDRVQLPVSDDEPVAGALPEGTDTAEPAPSAEEPIAVPIVAGEPEAVQDVAPPAAPLRPEVGTTAFAVIKFAAKAGYAVDLEGVFRAFLPMKEVSWKQYDPQWNQRFGQGERIEVYVQDYHEERDSYRVSVRELIHDPLLDLRRNTRCKVRLSYDAASGKIVVRCPELSYVFCVLIPNRVLDGYKQISGYAFPRQDLDAIVKHIDQSKRTVRLELV
ncbi:MAG: S1 RNA-binding domain-containing protein [Rikenellaceae bacterium]|nr:S1 RNA-binding domain-containing protein [Rikenellaceae bacterium]